MEPELNPQEPYATSQGDVVSTPMAQDEHIADFDDTPAEAWKYSDVMGAVASEQPKWRKVPPIKIFDQSASPDTRMACSRFALAHITNAQNALAYQSLDVQVDPSVVWREYLQANPMAKQVGATLLSAIEQFRKANLVSGYLVCQTKQDVMDAIDNGRFIYTGSRNGDWAEVKRTRVYKVGTRPVAHITAYFGYNTKYVVGINSYGTDDGTFAVDWDTFMSPEFMTKLAICDREDAEPLLKYRWNKI